MHGIGVFLILLGGFGTLAYVYKIAGTSKKPPGLNFGLYEAGYLARFGIGSHVLLSISQGRDGFVFWFAASRINGRLFRNQKTKFDKAGRSNISNER